MVPEKLYDECVRLKGDYGRGRDLEKFVRGQPEVHAKMFAQMGYFLWKMKEFFNKGEAYLDEATMAFVAASGCARFITTGKISNEDYECAAKLAGIRRILVHTQAGSYSKAVVYGKIVEVMKEVDELIAACERDARKLGLVINVESYIQREKPAEDSESPRIFKKH